MDVLVKKTINIPLPITQEENRRISEWAKRNGYFKGAMIKKLIMAAVEQDEAIRANKTQIDMTAIDKMLANRGQA